MIKTQCACCSRPISIDIDSQMKFHVHDPKASPLIFIPDVDFLKLMDPSIIDAF
ncbi:MAG: hypothetical protein KKE44_22030 [Proteobacteria bacterium]|nr:hypothetical protein [Pseudomonadota bacterium]MBU1585414.1 hypothetical protein [Pseudomonadota bacterium]MBU2455464.1 hypothetical protein [Pseudomonadota bacterium]MBU2627473.1 hypothetical protein [Pseudomonadota bacterium]